MTILLHLLDDALLRLAKLVTAVNPQFRPDLQGTGTALSNLAYKLPEELSRFYEWHTGLPVDSWLYKVLFPLGYIMPLEKAVAIREDFLQINRSVPREFRAEVETWSQQPIDDLYTIVDSLPGWHSWWLPVFEFNGDYWFTIWNEEERTTSPIYYIYWEGGGIHLAYDNLTSLLQATAEAFESGAYYLQDGRIEQHYGMAAAIIDKHNPRRRAYLLNAAGAQTIHEVVARLIVQSAEGNGGPFQALRLLGDPEIPQLLQALLQHEEMVVRFQAVRLIHHREEVGAVDALRPLVNDPDPEVKRYATWLLEEFRKKRHS